MESGENGRSFHHHDGEERPSAPSERGDVVVARYISLTFPEPGKIVLKVGPGDHTVQTFELSREQLRILLLDGLPVLLLK